MSDTKTKHSEKFRFAFIYNIAFQNGMAKGSSLSPPIEVLSPIPFLTSAKQKPRAHLFMFKPCFKCSSIPRPQTKLSRFSIRNKYEFKCLWVAKHFCYQSIFWERLSLRLQYIYIYICTYISMPCPFMSVFVSIIPINNLA